MDAEFKEGDQVYYKGNPAAASKARKKYIVRKVEQPEVSNDAKIALKQQQNESLYGKEIEKISQPVLSFTIEPLNGGEQIKVSQGEIELVG